MTTVLVVDDKEMLRDSVGVTLQRAGFTVLAAGDGEAALSLIARRRPAAVVTDLKMPGMSGIDLLGRIRDFDEDLPVILMTAYGTVETAVQAMQQGAYTYITKPFEGDELLVAVKRAIEHARLRRDNEVLRRSAEPDAAPVGAGERASATGLARLVGDSELMRRLREQIEAVAGSSGTVLIHGESGVGKEVVARAIHDLSPRAGEPFLAMNCAAISETLLESELFGHEKGAFTGADRLRKGRFELADQGTLLLDEISEVDSAIQAKLLRVLQERAFERVGSSVTIGVDVRVVATTNRDLTREVESGGFRQDLYFRLNVLPVYVPPLRERREDIPALATHFVETVCAREGRVAKRLSEGAVEALSAYDWPGNVRELQNICERAVVLSRGEEIERSLLEDWLPRPDVVVRSMAATELLQRPRADAAEPAGAVGALITGEEPRTLEDIERQAIVETLERFNGHRSKTAQALGIGVRTLGMKLKRWKEQRLVAESL